MNTRSKAVQGTNQTREGLESPRFIRGEDVKCALCAANGGTYDFAYRCCQVRYLMQEPRLEVRRAILEWWERKLGSGTTGLVCLRRGVRFIGCEIDPVHYKTAVARLKAEFFQVQRRMKR